MSRILIMACSATKRPSGFLIPAIELYDGPGYRTLRANMPEDLPVFILSAEHGLIRASERIGDYDRRMTPTRARELIDPVSDQLVELARGGELAGEIFMCGGGAYRHVLEDARDLVQCELEHEIPITFSSGGIGEQLSQLKQFLTGRDPRWWNGGK